MEFSRPAHWSGEPFPSPGGPPNPGIKPRSPALQADSLPAEPPVKLEGMCLNHRKAISLDPVHGKAVSHETDRSSKKAGDGCFKSVSMLSVLTHSLPSSCGVARVLSHHFKLHLVSNTHIAYKHRSHTMSHRAYVIRHVMLCITRHRSRTFSPHPHVVSPRAQPQPAAPCYERTISSPHCGLQGSV